VRLAEEVTRRIEAETARDVAERERDTARAAAALAPGTEPVTAPVEGDGPL
jgi:hypothetical protein